MCSKGCNWRAMTILNRTRNTFTFSGIKVDEFAARKTEWKYFDRYRSSLGSRRTRFCTIMLYYVLRTTPRRSPRYFYFVSFLLLIAFNFQSFDTYILYVKKRDFIFFHVPRWFSIIIKIKHISYVYIYTEYIWNNTMFFTHLTIIYTVIGPRNLYGLDN